MPRDRDKPDVLASIALDRARKIAPFVTLGIIVSFVLSEPLGVPLSWPVVLWNVIAIGALAAMNVALRRKRIGAHWGHAMMAALWGISTFGTLLSGSLTDIAKLTPIILIEVVCTAVMLQTRVVVVLLVALDLVWLPLIIIQGGDVGMFANAMLLAEVLAVLFQRLHREALLQVADQREQLLHAQRMEASGTLAAGLAHDMNNILASITSFADLLRDQVPEEAGQGDIDRIIAQAGRGAELTRGLLAFSRGGQYRKQVIAIDNVLRDVVPILSRTLPKSIQIRTTFETVACIDGDVAQIHQVIVNLGLNAADAMNGKGTLDIASTRIDVTPEAETGLPEGSYVRITVRDDGCGMDAATRLRVFEPFFTTKARGRGTGLGLSMVWGIVQNHGGTVDVASEPGQGATFTIHLPIVDALPADATVKPAATRATRQTTVLVIDDEEAVRTSTMRLLGRRGYDVLDAANGQEGLRVFAEHRDRIGLVVLDMGMPIMGGREFFHELRKISGVPVLVATGYADDDEAQALTAEGAALLEKPFAATALMGEVVRLLERGGPSRPLPRVESAHESNPSRAN
ncbi:MAG: response regulator [Kofleriaceae bacterium]|nr:response regulator [Kofleriaceae bacterium]